MKIKAAWQGVLGRILVTDKSHGNRKFKPGYESKRSRRPGSVIDFDEFMARPMELGIVRVLHQWGGSL